MMSIEYAAAAGARPIRGGERAPTPTHCGHRTRDANAALRPPSLAVTHRVLAALDADSP